MVEEEANENAHLQREPEHRNNERPNRPNRQRSVLSPLDDDITRSLLMRRVREIKIHDLQGDAVYDMNLNRNFIDVQIIRIITPNTNQKANIYAIRNRRANNQDVHFRRLFLCRVFSESDITEHSKPIYLMEASDQNNMLFERNLEWRDDGTISIGTFLRILAPLPIENNMQGDIALVKTQMPAVVMKRPSVLPSISINNMIEGNNSMAFVLNGVFLNLNRTVPVKTTCSGFLCDKQRCSDWNGKRGCGCYHMTQYRTNIAFEHSIYFDTQRGRIVHNNFSSTKFSLLYLNDNIPGAVRISALRMSNAYWEIEDAIENVVDYVNDNGGWTVVGWYKRGVINDRSLLEANSTQHPSNNQDSTNEVDAGQLSYHVVQLLPTNQDMHQRGNESFRELNDLRYDVSKINQA